MRMVSAPNISGTSVSTVAAPCATSASESLPRSGLAVMPEKPSDPPHFSPMRSMLSGRSVGWSHAATDCSSASIVMPSQYSSSTFCASRKRTLRGFTLPSSISCRVDIWLFSHPSPSTRTPPALGCVMSEQSNCLVCSWSHPSCEHPRVCAKARVGKPHPRSKSVASLCASEATHPTVGMTHSSLRMPARPSSLR